MSANSRWDLIKRLKG